MNPSYKISTTKLVLIVSAFLTLTGNTKFFTEIVSVYPLAENWAFVGSLSIWLFAFLSTFLLLICYRLSVKPILILLLLISSILSYFNNNYGTIFDNNMITNLLETNLKESLDLFSIKLFSYFVLLGIFPAIWVYKVPIKHFNIVITAWSKIKTIVSLIVVFILVTLIFSKSYTSFARENKQLRLYINPTYFMYVTGKHVFNEFKSIDPQFVTIGEDAVIHRGSNSKKLIIVIVGEAARADRFALNGYMKQTNPLLLNERVVSFKKMSSCGTDTALSLPCMFSILGRDEYSHIQGKNMSNALDIISSTGVEILWRDNNSSSKSVADRVTYKDYRSAENNTICDVECRDEGMLVGLQTYINQHKDKDIMIVLHMMGSHGPSYYKRYPKAFEKYTPTCETNQLNECSNEEINNAYDNTILYTDYFLSKTIELLKANQNNHKTAMLYVSDHGESLGENGLYLHGMPYFIAPKEQTHISSILWFDDNFSTEIDWRKLNKKTNEIVSHDGMFHTLLGLMDIQSQTYNMNLDWIPYKKLFF